MGGKLNAFVFASYFSKRTVTNYRLANDLVIDVIEYDSRHCQEDNH